MLTVQVFKNHHDCNPFQPSSHYFVLFHVPFLPPFNVLSSCFCFTQLKVVVPQIIYDKFSDILFDKIFRPSILIFL